MILLSYEKAFELCREAIESINPSKIKIEDQENGVFEIRTRMNWESFGTIVRLNLIKIGENITEVRISTRPIPRTVLVDYGEGWKYSEHIVNYLKEKDAVINKKVLAQSVEVLDDVYVKPLQQEKVTRQK